MLWVFLITTGTPPHEFPSRINQQDQVLVGVCLLLSGSVTAPKAHAADTFKQGLQDGWSLSDSGVPCCGQLLEEELPRMAEVGARHLRVNLRLGRVLSRLDHPGCSRRTWQRGAVIRL